MIASKINLLWNVFLHVVSLFTYVTISSSSLHSQRQLWLIEQCLPVWEWLSESLLFWSVKANKKEEQKRVFQDFMTCTPEKMCWVIKFVINIPMTQAFDTHQSMKTHWTRKRGHNGQKLQSHWIEIVKHIKRHGSPFFVLSLSISLCLSQTHMLSVYPSPQGEFLCGIWPVKVCTVVHTHTIVYSLHSWVKHDLFHDQIRTLWTLWAIFQIWSELPPTLYSSLSITGYILFSIRNEWFRRKHLRPTFPVLQKFRNSAHDSLTFKSIPLPVSYELQ